MYTWPLRLWRTFLVEEHLIYPAGSKAFSCFVGSPSKVEVTASEVDVTASEVDVTASEVEVTTSGVTNQHPGTWYSVISV